MQPAGWPRMDCPHVGVPCLLAVPCSPQAQCCGTQATCESPWVGHAHPDVLHPPLPRPPWTWHGGTHKIWKFPVPTPTSPILIAPPGLVLQYPEDTNVPLVSHRCPRDNCPHPAVPRPWAVPHSPWDQHYGTLRTWRSLWCPPPPLCPLCWRTATQCHHKGRTRGTQSHSPSPGEPCAHLGDTTTSPPMSSHPFCSTPRPPAKLAVLIVGHPHPYPSR